MKQGGKARLVIPADLAYGPGGMGNAIGPNETLVFEVELLEINPQAEAQAEAAAK
jgi:FKBP-type peptidyl-prolyl cis-trans isomerase